AVYFLRVAALDRAGNRGDWKTVLAYHHDQDQPGVPTTDKRIDWTTTANPTPGVWGAAEDTGGSGIAGYFVYWGVSADAQDKTIFRAGTNEAARTYPLLLDESGIYYLRVAAQDIAENIGDWKTVLTYHFDKDTPLPPLSPSPSAWTNVASVPDGSWPEFIDNGSGVAGYHYYWSKDVTDNPQNPQFITQNHNNYAGLSCNGGSGVYQLMVRAQDKLGHIGEWASVLTYRYDKEPPGQSPTSINIEWTNEDAAKISWSPAEDTGGSDIGGYYVYWGTSANGQTEEEDCFQSGNDSTARSYQLSVSDSGIYYLRVAAQDTAGNVGAWQTVLTYYFDKDRPGVAPASPTVDWTNDANPQSLNWDSAADTGGSGVDGYYIYWGTSANGQNDDAAYFRQGNTMLDRRIKPTVLKSTGEYYLRVKAVDLAGNVGDWQTVLVYYFDNTKPGQPSAAEDTNTWHNDSKVPNGSWTAASDEGSGINGYYVHWGKDTPSDTQTQYQTDTNYKDLYCDHGQGIYRLSVRAKDKAGNVCDEWTTVL
ncbi:hypothetical protein NO2_1632, partial [Candidatus Termititenax persephonae]